MCECTQVKCAVCEEEHCSDEVQDVGEFLVCDYCVEHFDSHYGKAQGVVESVIVHVEPPMLRE